MYMTMSISTGLYPKLDLLTANKLLTYLPTFNRDGDMVLYFGEVQKKV